MNQPESAQPTSSNDSAAEALRQAAAAMGRARSEKKTAAARRNHLKSPHSGRPPRPLAEYPCTCGATTDDTHKTTCARGKAYRRQSAARRQPPA